VQGGHKTLDVLPKDPHRRRARRATVERMRSSDHTRHLWYDVGWPVLAGTVTAVGVVAAYLGIGLLATVAAFLLMELTVAPTAWSILTDMGRPGRVAVVELAPAVALGTVVMLGLVEWSGAWAVPLMLLVVGTSPLVERGRRRSLIARYGSQRAETRRQFEDIVAHAFTSPEDDGPR
jgi:hypothetical protein